MPLGGFFAAQRRQMSDVTPGMPGCVLISVKRWWTRAGMLARQFPIDKPPLVQPLMRAKPPRTWVDRKFLLANCVARAHLAGPNHVPAHDIKSHGIKDFCVVRNLRHCVAVLSKNIANQICAPPRDRAWPQPDNGSIVRTTGSPTTRHFFVTSWLCCNGAFGCPGESAYMMPTVRTRRRHLVRARRDPPARLLRRHLDQLDVGPEGQGGRDYE